MAGFQSVGIFFQLRSGWQLPISFGLKNNVTNISDEDFNICEPFILSIFLCFNENLFGCDTILNKIIYRLA